VAESEKDRLARLKKEQEGRMMEFDVQPAKNKKEKKIIKKAKKTNTPESN
jgi:hypothetical protein